MINKPLLLKMYEAASMQRWNDQIRVIDFTELDKQGHKMIIAYCLAKCEEERNTPGFSWTEIIEAGIFEYLQRIVLTDLKPPLFHKIKAQDEQYALLSDWVYKRIHPEISVLGEAFCSRFHGYLHDRERTVNRRIISAAHFYATKWEFDIIERATPHGFGIEEIKRDIFSKQERYQDLKSMQAFLRSRKLQEFVNVCGHLRFQIRWSHVHRVPRTSVLGHMLIVAMFSYLFSLQIKAGENRAVNNYCTGLFHDLPEILTRDIINPVKRSVEGLAELIKEYEREEMEEKIYKLIPKAWHQDMRLFTENEFETVTSDTGESVRDGALVKAVDELAAFIEAFLSLRNGIHNADLQGALEFIKRKYSAKTVAGVDFSRVYTDFDIYQF